MSYDEYEKQMTDALFYLLSVGNLREGIEGFKESLIKKYEETQNGDGTLFYERLRNTVAWRELDDDSVHLSLIRIAEMLFSAEDDRDGRQKR